jgi:hypothetical protein
MKLALIALVLSGCAGEGWNGGVAVPYPVYGYQPVYPQYNPAFSPVFNPVPINTAFHPAPLIPVGR